MPHRAPDLASEESSTAHTSSDAQQIADETADKIQQAGDSRREEGLGNPEVGAQLSKEEADRKYEEAIEEEYAKREGGA